MKCPHCEYFYGWDGEMLENIGPEEGDFYSLPVKLERENYGLDYCWLYACPKCRKTFTEI